LIPPPQPARIFLWGEPRSLPVSKRNSMELKNVGKDEFFQMIERLKDFSRELVIWEPVANQLNIDIEEIKVSTRSLLQIMQVVDRQIEADPANEAVKRQCLSFYEMGMEICTKFEELHTQLEDRSDRH
jgi:hypothetical protein